MDLNIDNYSTDDLLSIFNINDKNTSIIELEKYLSKSISIIIAKITKNYLKIKKL